jgi:hypothetical protein
MGEQGSSERRPTARIPMGQAFLDDLFLLLALGILIPFLSYLVWGLLDLGSVPVVLPR